MKWPQMGTPPGLERADMTTDMAAEKLKASGWTIVETSGFDQSCRAAVAARRQRRA